jgi:transaldolase
MTDAGKDGISECERMQDITNGMNSSIRILAASIRNAKSMRGLIAHGMDTSTFSPDIVRDLFSEGLAICAAEDFEAQLNVAAQTIA